MTRVPGRPKKACATALPVSPEVATSTVRGVSSALRCAISRAMTRAPTSLKANVGPWKSSSAATPVVKRHQRNREVERRGQQSLQSGPRYVLADETCADLGAQLDERCAAQAVERQRIDALGHIQTAIGREALNSAVAKGYRRGPSAGADEAHQRRSRSAPTVPPACHGRDPEVGAASRPRP